jgi:hypothetical protein
MMVVGALVFLTAGVGAVSTVVLFGVTFIDAVASFRSDAGGRS